MYPFFTVFLLFALFTLIFMKRSSNDFSKSKEEFMNLEREANSVRKQPLTDLKYITIDYSSIPQIETDDEYINDRLNTLKVLSEENNKIVNLSAYTNTDLKLKYGVANLPLLTEYDQNFTALCRALFELGKRLYDSGNSEKALFFLELGIKCGTDLKSHYTLLADIYEQNMQYKEIVGLIHSADNVNSVLRDALIKDLKSRLEGTNYSADESEKPLENINTSAEE